jgi:VIT1/CCC1 family predicted Fe2+/Mn2+ transporter
MSDGNRFLASIVLTLGTLFAAGVMRAYVTGESYRASVLEMLGLGALVAAVAYYVGRLVASLGGML